MNKNILEQFYPHLKHYLAHLENLVGESVDYSSHFSPIYGSHKQDSLYGNHKYNILYGLNGRDHIYGKQGDDILYGGHGNDFLYGGKGHDLLKGGKGNDFLRGGKGHDLLVGNKGNDAIRGGKGDDILVGGKGHDWLKGGPGADIYKFNLHQPTGYDVIINFQADDALKFSGVYDYKTLYENTDFISHLHHTTLKFEYGGSVTIKGYGINDWSDLNVMLETEYRTIDGQYNNLHYPEYGSTQQIYLRYPGMEADYADGIGSLKSGPNPRHVSNEIFDQASSIPEANGFSAALWTWGQFVDHDIDLTPTNQEQISIVWPGDDISLIPMNRSEYINGDTSPREQFNDITSYLDASMIYGSDAERAAFLRDEGGKLKISEDGLLPFNTANFPNAPSDSDQFFIAGDVRANENMALTSMHTLFVREHNRLVEEIAAQHPEYSDEQLYQEAKLLVEAEIQHITYSEFLPLLLGEGAIADYTYDPNVNPGISNEFATAVYRLGHTLLGNDLGLADADGTMATVLLHEAFFNPQHVVDNNIDPILRAIGMLHSETVDTQIVDAVRNFLFAPQGEVGLDLAAINIQRGRDHGLPDYNTAREAYGLERVTTFSEITSDAVLAAKLEAIYGDVDSIDLFVGGLAEDHLANGIVGELFSKVLIDQFTRTQNGDRLWYEGRLSEEQLELIENMSLADVIKNNTNITYLQDNVFIAYNRVGDTQAGGNTVIGTNQRDLIIGFEGNDTLTGNGGDDIFAFALGDGMDIITDFKANGDQDQIDLSAFKFEFADLDIQGPQIDINGSDKIMLVNFNGVLTEGDFIL